MAVSKRSFKRRRFTRSKRTVAAPVKRYVKRQFNRRLEHKFIYDYANNDTVTRSGYIYDLTDIQRGTQSFARIGDDITFIRLMFRYEVFQRDSILLNLDSHNNIRLILLQWKPEYSKDPPLPEKILELDTSIGNDPTLASYNADRRKDYTILYDKLHILTGEPVYNGSSVTYYSGPSSYKTGRSFIYSKRVPNKTITFSSEFTAGYGKNHIILLAVSDSAVVPSPEISFSSQFSYTDA